MAPKVAPQAEFGCTNSATDVAARAGCGNACDRVSASTTGFCFLVVV